MARPVVFAFSGDFFDRQFAERGAEIGEEIGLTLLDVFGRLQRGDRLAAGVEMALGLIQEITFELLRRFDATEQIGRQDGERVNVVGAERFPTGRNRRGRSKRVGAWRGASVQSCGGKMSGST